MAHEVIDQAGTATLLSHAFFYQKQKNNALSASFKSLYLSINDVTRHYASGALKYSNCKRMFLFSGEECQDLRHSKKTSNIFQWKTTGFLGKFSFQEYKYKFE